MYYTNEQIRSFIRCPRLGSKDYGEWGALRLEQRLAISNLLDRLDSADAYIRQLYKENEELKDWKSEQGCSIQEVYELFIPKSVIREKLEKTKQNRDCTYCNNTCNKYWLCKCLKELLGEE